jgi:hypothetical protein
MLTEDQADVIEFLAAPSARGVPGAVVIRRDEIRKRLSGVSPLDRLGPEGYSSEMSARVYATVAEPPGGFGRRGSRHGRRGERALRSPCSRAGRHVRHES